VYKFIKEIGRSPLTAQQKKTLRGQVLAGDVEGAKKGFERLTRRVNRNVGRF
jgi:hypothetical protein